VGAAAPEPVHLARQVRDVIADVPRFLTVLLVRGWHRRRAAGLAEASQTMPGDESFPGGQYRCTRAITIAAAPEELWPCLVHAGCLRARLHAVHDPRRPGTAHTVFLMEFGDSPMMRRMPHAIRERAQTVHRRRVPPRVHVRRLALIRGVHTAAWFSIEACVAYPLWSGATGRSDQRAAWAAAVVGGECLIFAADGFRCPLTGLAEAAGATSGSVTDIYLPTWFARNLPAIHVPLLLLIGWLHGRTLRRRRGPRTAAPAKGQRR
jgi:hypothetical protein